MKERVDRHVGLGRRAHASHPVRALALLGGERVPPVVRARHVVVVVHLQDVAALPIDHETPDHEIRIERDLEDLLRVATLLDELALRDTERELVDLPEAVMGQRVVEVEAEGGDRPHPEVPVHEDAGFSLDAVQWRGLRRAILGEPGRGPAVRRRLERDRQAGVHEHPRGWSGTVGLSGRQRAPSSIGLRCGRSENGPRRRTYAILSPMGAVSATSPWSPFSSWSSASS